MKLLKTIYRYKKINIKGKTFLREAVRGIIFREGKLLMIYSPVNGDYKFPGGGVDADESYHEALHREINEEAGATVIAITGEFGKMLEYSNAIEEDYETFKMYSYYYFCKIEKGFGVQRLDDYEEELGFRPIWVDIERALETNKKLLAESNPAPRWTRREVFVLEMLRKNLGKISLTRK